jgi:outer membrane protein OmpA-like peptidoglycan-associated protein
MKNAPDPHGGTDQFLTFGMTDLMTSVAIIFLLLFLVALQSTSLPPVSANVPPLNQIPDQIADQREPLKAQFERLGLPIEKDPDDQQVLLLAMPEELLNFDFGRATLRPTAVVYLREAIPGYASALCGPLRNMIESVTIEGHTDDVGDDQRNLRLSQERAFQVIVQASEILQNRPEASCFQRLTTASGRGKQDLFYDLDNQLNRNKSRRVVFKIRLFSAAPSPTLYRPSPPHS